MSSDVIAAICTPLTAAAIGIAAGATIMCAFAHIKIPLFKKFVVIFKPLFFIIIIFPVKSTNLKR